MPRLWWTASFARAKVSPTQFADDELPLVRRYLEEGGTLWLFRERHDLFNSDAGRKLLSELCGAAALGQQRRSHAAKARAFLGQPFGGARGGVALAGEGRLYEPAQG